MKKICANCIYFDDNNTFDNFDDVCTKLTFIHNNIVIKIKSSDKSIGVLKIWGCNLFKRNYKQTFIYKLKTILKL